MTWTQPICEKCWVEQEAKWEGERLVEIRTPHKVIGPDMEQCAWCGQPTIVGIYKRADPETVPYPRVVAND